MITQSDLQELLAFDAEGARVLSLYLDADTSHQTSETVKLQVRADIGHGIAFHRSLRIGHVDRLQPVDQRHVRARQRAARQFRLDQGAQGRKLFDTVVGQVRGRDTPRRRQGQRPLGRKAAHRFPRRSHRNAETLGKAAKRQCLPRCKLTMHDLLAKRAIEAVVRRCACVGWAGLWKHVRLNRCGCDHLNHLPLRARSPAGAVLTRSASANAGAARNPA